MHVSRCRSFYHLFFSISLHPAYYYVKLSAVIGAVFAVLVFRLVIIRFMYENAGRLKFFGQFSKIIATCVAASINAVVIEMGMCVRTVCFFGIPPVLIWYSGKKVQSASVAFISGLI